MAVLPGFDFRRELTIDNTKIDAVQTDLPILVKLDNSNFDFTKVEQSIKYNWN